jgi:sugar phosphate isomerase/epimerase
MKAIKGPAVFLAQFVDKKAPFNSLDGMCKWAADLGYKGIQIPTWESFLIDLDKLLRVKIIVMNLLVR